MSTRPSEGTTSGPKRSLIATFRRSGFLKFVYFTDQENRDPQADDNAVQPRGRSRPTASTASAPRARTAAASEIQFADDDAINGPLHTNDESLLVCGSPRFGREKLKDGSPGMTDTIEVSGAAPGYVANGELRDDAEDLHARRGKFSRQHRDDGHAASQPGAGRASPTDGGTRVLGQDDHPPQEQR